MLAASLFQEFVADRGLTEESPACEALAAARADSTVTFLEAESTLTLQVRGFMLQGVFELGAFMAERPELRLQDRPAIMHQLLLLASVVTHARPCAHLAVQHWTRTTCQLLLLLCGCLGSHSCRSLCLPREVSTSDLPQRAGSLGAQHSKSRSETLLQLEPFKVLASWGVELPSAASRQAPAETFVRFRPSLSRLSAPRFASRGFLR